MKKKRRGAMTWSEWENLRNSDPEMLAKWQHTVERERQLEEARQLWQAIFHQNETPILIHLRKVGLEIDSLPYLYNRKNILNSTEPLPDYSCAIPILSMHLKGDYLIPLRETIVRALTDPKAHKAFEALVEEFKVSLNRKESDELLTQRLLKEGGYDKYYTQKELHAIFLAHWDSYRFALANAIGYLFQKVHIPLILELISDKLNGDIPRETLIQHLDKKARRWKLYDQAITSVLVGIALEGGNIGATASKVLEKLEK